MLKGNTFSGFPPMLLMFLGGSLIPVCKVQVSVRCTATLTIPIRSNQSNAHFLVNHPEWNPTMRWVNQLIQLSQLYVIEVDIWYTHDLNWFHGWGHHLTSYKIDSFTSQVGHHIATTSSPLFASTPNFLAGLCRSFAPASTRRDCVWGARKTTKGTSLQPSDVVFFNIQGYVRRFFLNDCLCFFVFEWVLVWVWFSRIVFNQNIIDGTTVSFLSHRARAKCMFLYPERCLATAKWQFWHQLFLKKISLLFWRDLFLEINIFFSCAYRIW